MQEPKIRYYLEPSRGLNSNEKRLIMAEVNYRYAIIRKDGRKAYRPFRISLRKSIKPEHFGSEENNFIYDDIIFSKSQRNNTTIRRAQTELEDAVNEVYLKYDKIGETPSPSQYKSEVETILGRKSELVKEQPTIIEFLYTRISKYEENLERGIQNAIKTNTIKTYNTLARHIENYTLATGDILRFETFNEDKYWVFLDTLDDILRGEYTIDNPNQPKKQRVQEYGFLKTSIRKIQSSFLRMFKEALKNGDLRSGFQPDQEGLLVTRKSNSKDLYVTEEELNLIIASDCSHSVKLQKAKEYIIIGCLTGLRNESMLELNNEHIRLHRDKKLNFSYVRSKHNKTQTEVFIPLLKPVLEIVESHGGQFPKFYSNSKTNSDLKGLFRYLEIDRPVLETLDPYRGEVITTEKSLHELISTHDVKKTFTTILAGYHLPESIISSITHPDKPSQNKMFQVYDNRSMLDRAKEFVKAIINIDSQIYKVF